MSQFEDLEQSGAVSGLRAVMCSHVRHVQSCAITCSYMQSHAVLEFRCNLVQFRAYVQLRAAWNSLD